MKRVSCCICGRILESEGINYLCQRCEDKYEDEEYFKPIRKKNVKEE